jgi:tetratricopeptide (TPR) repeat protein
MAPSALPATGSLIVDPPTLQRRAVELLAAVDEDPKRGAERIAAAEAHLRLVVTGAAKDKAARLLERALDLDPYRVETYLLAALTSHREGRLGPALERYEQAAALAPDRFEVRFHCGFGFLDAARRSALSDEDTAELAEVASSHFEAALALDPAHVPAAIGAIESAIYGKATRLRDALGRLFSRVAPAEALRPTVTRLLYQAVFAFRVGKAKGVDQKNKKTMGELADVARAWLAAFPADPGLEGVIAAAAAKCEPAEELCAHLAEHARAIPDVRVLRLLLRERLADVADPQKRLELFEGAMKGIPLLDGIAHDYLQLLHLVAKRAAAEGDLEAARAAWLRCQEIDPRSPATTQNLLRLALHHGNADDAARLERRLLDLWTLYVEHSPRPDLVLGRAAARAQVTVDADLERLHLGVQEEKRPSSSSLMNLVRRWARAQALARLAVEPALLAGAGLDLAKRLLATEPEEALSTAIEVLARPVVGTPPTIYTALNVARDADDDEIARAREGWREGLLRAIEMERAEGGPVGAYERHLERTTEAARVLTDPTARAAYDASTCPTPQAELYRRHVQGYTRLVELSSALGEHEEVAARAKLAALLSEIPRAILRPHLAVLLKDETWLELMLLRVQYAGLVTQGWKLLNDGHSDQVLDLCARHLAPADKLASKHRLRAFATLMDAQGSVWWAASTAREYAREALKVAHWSDMTAPLIEMQRYAAYPLEVLAQHVATERARKLLDVDRTRDALFELWSAYAEDHQRERPKTFTPAAKLFNKLRPAGTGFYAFTVAQVLRSNVISWYNDSTPRYDFEVTQLKSGALALTKIAGTWAWYARENIGADPLHAAEASKIMVAINNLVEVLEKDLRKLA